MPRTEMRKGTMRTGKVMQKGMRKETLRGKRLLRRGKRLVGDS